MATTITAHELPLKDFGDGEIQLTHDADPQILDRSAPSAFDTLIREAVALGFCHIDYKMMCFNDMDLDEVSVRPTQRQLRIQYYTDDDWMLAAAHETATPDNPGIKIISTPLKPLQISGSTIALSDDLEIYDQITIEQALTLLHKIAESITTTDPKLTAKHSRAAANLQTFGAQPAQQMIQAIRAGFADITLIGSDLSSEHENTLCISTTITLKFQDWNWFYLLENHPDHHSTGAAQYSMTNSCSWFYTEHQCDGATCITIDHHPEMPHCAFTPRNLTQTKASTWIDAQIKAGPKWPAEMIVVQADDADLENDDYHWV